MALWHQHAPAEAEAWKAHKGGHFLGRRGRKAKVSSAGGYKLNDLIRIALTKAEMDVWEALPKKLNHRHQDIARVHVGRRHGQSSLIRIGMIRSHTADILNIAQDASRYFYDTSARFGKSRDPIAPADQQLSPQFLFELANLPRDAWLRRVQRLCCFGEIEFVIGDPAQITQLLQIHGQFNYASQLSIDNKQLLS
jgi:hypothetical protein